MSEIINVPSTTTTTTNQDKSATTEGTTMSQAKNVTTIISTGSSQNVIAVSSSVSVTSPAMSPVVTISAHTSNQNGTPSVTVATITIGQLQTTTTPITNVSCSATTVTTSSVSTVVSSTYLTTQEHTNYARVCRAIVDVGGDISRAVFTKYVKPHELLGRLKTGLPLKLSKQQQKLVLDAQKTGYGTFDITLLYTLIRNVSMMPCPTKGWQKEPRATDVTEADDIERIHFMRNDAYSHVTCTKDIGKDWKKYWNELEGICRRMDQRLSGTKFEEELDVIRTCTMDDDTLRYYREELKALVEREFDLTERIKDIENLIKENKDFVENERRRIEKMTLLEIQMHKKGLFVKRENVEKKALELLSRDQKRVCILSGKAGFGKTSLCMEILSHFAFEPNTSSKIYILREPSEWRKVMESEEQSIFFIDDFLGKSNLDVNLLNAWERHFHSIEACINKGVCTVLMGTRDELLAQAAPWLSKYIIFKPDNVICISSKQWSMTNTEKQRMLNAYSLHFAGDVYTWIDKLELVEKRHDLLLSHKEIEEISRSDPLDGFPQACFLFFTNYNFYRQKVGFFTSATNSVCTEINLLYSPDDRRLYVQYLLLVFLMLRNGHSSLNNIPKEKLQPICDDLEVRYPNGLLIRNAITLLNKTFIKESQSEPNIFSFTHESVFEAVLLSFGEYFPDALLRHADDQVIFDFVRSSNYSKKEREICILIPETWNLAFAERITLSSLNVANHSSLSDIVLTNNVLDVLEKAASEFSTETIGERLREMTFAACKNAAHVFLKALVDRIRESSLLPSPSIEDLHDCLRESIGGSDAFSVVQILRILNTDSLQKEKYIDVVSQAVTRYVDSIDVIKHLLKYRHDRHVLIALVDTALSQNKGRLVLWTASRSRAYEKSQAIYRYALLNSINYRKLDITKELIKFPDIDLNIYVHALELALSLPDMLEFNLFVEKEEITRISPVELVNLIWRACILHKDGALTRLLQNGDMSRVSQNVLVAKLFDLKHYYSNSEDVMSSLVAQICETNFLSDKSYEEKKQAVVKDLDTLESQTTDAYAKSAFRNMFMLSVKELNEMMHLRKSSDILNALEMFKMFPLSLFTGHVSVDEIEETASKSLLYAVWFGMEDMLPHLSDAIFPQRVIPSHVMKLVVTEYLKGGVEEKVSDLVELLDPKEVSVENLQHLYLRGKCSKNVELVSKLQEQFEINNDTMLLGSFVECCVDENKGENELHLSNSKEFSPKTLETALLYVVENEPPSIQTTVMKSADLSFLSQKDLLKILQLAVLHAEKEVVSLLLQGLAPLVSSAETRDELEKAFSTIVEFREAELADEFMRLIDRSTLSQQFVCRCVEKSIELGHNEMTETLVHTFGEHLLSPENLTHTVRFGSGKFLDAVLETSKLSQQNLHNSLLVAICCEKKDIIESLVYACDVPVESKRKIRDKLFEDESADIMHIFECVEEALGGLTPSCDILEEQFLLAVRNEQFETMQCLLDKFGSTAFREGTVEAAFKMAVRSGEEISISLLLANFDVMKRADVAKFCINQVVFSQKFGILELILGEQKYTYDVLEDAITNMVLLGNTSVFETFIDHLDFDKVKGVNVSSIFQMMFMNYNADIARVFHEKFDMSRLPLESIKTQVGGTIFQTPVGRLEEVINRMRYLNVPQNSINDAIQNRVMMALHIGDSQTAKSCITYLDPDDTTDLTILSILMLMFNSGRHQNLERDIILTWKWKDEKNKRKLLKVAFHCKVYRALEAIYTIVENVDGEYLSAVVKEIIENQNPEILRRLLTTRRIKFETALMLFYVSCASASLEALKEILLDFYELFEDYVTPAIVGDALIFAASTGNASVVEAVINKMEENIFCIPEAVYRNFLVEISKELDVEGLEHVLLRIDCNILSTDSKREILRCSLASADEAKLKVLFKKFGFSDDDLLVALPDAEKTFGPIPEDMVIYARQEQSTKWPSWLMERFQTVHQTDREQSGD